MHYTKEIKRTNKQIKKYHTNEQPKGREKGRTNNEREK